MLNKLCPAGDVLKLKLNAQVILLKNMNFSNSLVNGSRGCVVGFGESNKLPIVKFLNGMKVTVKYESWSFKMNASTGQMAARKQIPLQLAWAISIHKSQVSECEFIQLNTWIKKRAFMF